jgi:pimeloyl-ACP methyl ester carboxylesterase
MARSRDGSIAGRSARDDPGIGELLGERLRLACVRGALCGAAPLHHGESHLAFFDIKGVDIPVGVTVFPDELYPAPESWAKRAYPKLVHYNRVPKGGHFAAWEQPESLSQELRATFRSVR